VSSPPAWLAVDDLPLVNGAPGAFYNGLKSKVGLAAARAAALRVNLNVQGCGIVTTPMHAPSRTPLLLPLLSHNRLMNVK